MSESRSGFKIWGDWSFDYGVFGSEGLCLVDGIFKGQRVFNKLSLPVIRVKYVQDEYWGGLSSLPPLKSAPPFSGCGPYNDQITWDLEDFGENLNPISGPHHLIKTNCPDEENARYICIQEETPAGKEPRLKLSVYARIGAYHISQQWYIYNTGRIQPRVFSKGLSCNLDHVHHPYWRFDFSLGAPETHRVEVWHQPSNGGNKLADITTEGRVVNSTFGRMIEYRIISTRAGDFGPIRQPARVAIMPPDLDSTKGIAGPDSFSTVDGYVRKFRPEEDRAWNHEDKGEQLAFAVHDSCVDADIVFWSVCHLHHHADEGADHWHEVGPDLVFTPMVQGNLPPETLRAVNVSGTISVKDVRIKVGPAGQESRRKHDDFAKQVLVNPDASTADVMGQVVAGDVTGLVRIRVTWNPDSSVNVSFTARLLDENSVVAEVKNQFNVLRDAHGSWSGIHLVDYHTGDPDSAEISFEIENSQQ